MAESKEAIAGLLAKELKLKKEGILSLIEIPPNPEMGDYAFPCFQLAGKLKKAPNQIAQDLAGKLKPGKEISKIQAAGPYINFFINKNILAEQTISTILKEKENYGKGNEKGKTIIEFLAPNTNKPLHLGHLRNMSIGESVSRILEFNGNKLVRTNLYNDRGIHICKSMLAYKQFGKNKKPDKKTDHFVGDFYVLFSKKVEENFELEKQAQEMLQKWEKEDKETLNLWRKMNDWAIKGIEETYKRFGIKFDKQYYESKFYKKGKSIIENGLKKSLFKKRKDNAVIINFGKELGEKVLLRADGTSVYITQDLALANLKYQEYKPDRLIYVVGNEQDYHFKVLFKILKLLKFPFADKSLHLSYGMVFLPEGRMKSREGTVVDADDIISEMQELAKKELEQRYKLSKQEVEKRSLSIALSAIKYFFLKVEYTKDMVFNPEEALNFEGNSGPYLQYSYARASSILRKSKKKPEVKIIDLKESEIALIKQLSQFPELVHEAYEKFNPALIANYAFSLSQQFNEFYANSKVIGSKEEPFLLSLVQAFRYVLKSALSLLGIDVLEEM